MTRARSPDAAGGRAAAAAARGARRRVRLWAAAQAVSVTAALAAVALLFLRPALGLRLVWDVLVPVVPAVLLFAPQVWRRLCPIGVVHQWPVRLGRAGARRLPAVVGRAAPAVAAAAFFAIVPLRLVVFNDHGPAVGVFVLAVLGLALAGGLLFPGKSGWCATFCPVLPVERLYGQTPVIDAPHAHCARCVGCVRSCYDLKPRRSLAELATPGGPIPGGERDAARRRRLLGTPMGTFGLLFPGFVLGYFLTDPDASTGAIYLGTLGPALGSAVALGAAQRVGRLRSTTVLRVAAALAALIYYGFSLPTVVSTSAELLGWHPPMNVVVPTARGCATLMVGAWLLLGAGRADDADGGRRRRVAARTRLS